MPLIGSYIGFSKHKNEIIKLGHRQKFWLLCVLISRHNSHVVRRHLQSLKVENIYLLFSRLYIFFIMHASETYEIMYHFCFRLGERHKAVLLRHSWKCLSLKTFHDGPRIRVKWFNTYRLVALDKRIWPWIIDHWSSA